MEQKRLFVAVDLSTEAVDRLSRLQEAAKDNGAVRAVRWLPRENLHVTLHFLGDTPTDQLERVKSALATVDARSPFPCCLSHTGCFPNPRSPRVLWAGLEEGAENVAALAESVSGALVSAGFPKPNKPFRPHVTLGYVRKQTAAAAARAIFARLSEAASEIFGAGLRCDVTEYSLVESRLKPEGAEHITVQRYPLESYL